MGSENGAIFGLAGKVLPSTDLSAKVCQTKNALTEVDHPLSSAKTSESCVSESPVDAKVSSIPHVSCKENVGRFHEKRVSYQDFEGRHFVCEVCAIDEVNYEHVRGFPVEIDLEGPPRDDDEDSGYVSTPEHERDEAMPSDLEKRKEAIPQEPESDFSEDFEEP